MKTWDPHLLIAWGGTLGTPPLDVWTNTLRALVFEPDGVTRSVLTVAEQDEVLPLLQPLINTFITAPAAGSSMISGAAKCTWIKANMIAATGKYMYPTTSVRDIDPGIAGGAASASDWRISLVPTLLTGKSRGKAHSGRFYPPAIVPAMTTAGSPYVTTAQAQQLANATYDFVVAGIGGLTLASGKTLVSVITSPGESDVAVDPVSNMVIAVEVDRVPDTQRRRTNRVPRSVVGNA